MSYTTGKPKFRPTYAAINLQALSSNYIEIKKHLPRGAHVMAMVKADAYGHGAVPVSRLLEEEGVRVFGVATVEEAMELREAGIKKEILVMGGLMGAGSPASEKMVELSLTPVIHSEGVLESLDVAAARFGKKIGVHLKVDTGMSRLGVRPESLKSLVARIPLYPNITVEGVMTHFADAGDQKVTGEQEKLFLSCRETVESALGKIKVWHAANSTALFIEKYSNVKGADEVWVRPGLSLYGDCEGAKNLGDKLLPVMNLVSQVVLLKSIPEGTRVSYGGEFTAKRKTRLAIVPVGYADGYHFSLTGKARVLIRGMKLPVVGRVTMDMIMVDVTDLPTVSVNDEVILMGRQGDESITVKDLAVWAGTIPYEIMCGISKRIPRVYC